MLWNAKNRELKLGRSWMAYARFGRGNRHLILLPGLSDGLATVRGKALLLAAPYRPFLDDFTIWMFSRKDDMPGGFTIRDMARDQALAMDLLGIRKASVMGVSQGGMIAQYLAADYGNRVDRLVLAVTAPAVNETIRENVRLWMDLAEKGDHRALMIDTAEKSYSEAWLKGLRLLYPVMGFVGRPRDYGRFQANARAILSFDASEALERIACPTLIIGGGRDRTVGPDAARLLHEGIPGSRLHIYPDLGHAAYEEAEDFNRRVFGFLAE